jgi:serine O-acetyltransferase
VISDGVVLGRDVSLYHQVSIGWQETRFGMSQPPVPVIGDRARIGTGARVMGEVRVGEDALVGANAVIFKDVPPGSTAMGNPARIVTPPTPDAGGTNAG